MKKLPKEMTENGIHYTLHGDHYMPDISIPDGDRTIGKWGWMRLKFLMENKPILYNQMILNGTMQSQPGRNRSDCHSEAGEDDSRNGSSRRN